MFDVDIIVELVSFVFSQPQSVPKILNVGTSIEGLLAEKYCVSSYSPLCSSSFQHIDVDSSMLCCRIRKSHGSFPILLPLGHLIDLVLLLLAFQESGDVPNHLYLVGYVIKPMSSLFLSDKTSSLTDSIHFLSWCFLKVNLVKEYFFSKVNLFNASVEDPWHFGVDPDLDTQLRIRPLSSVTLRMQKKIFLFLYWYTSMR
jgi:hypothetical protein